MRSLGDFVIERDHSFPREVNLDLSDEQIDDFMKWVSGLQKARATTKATADSSASLRNDKQKGENESKGQPYEQQRSGEV
jgi:hypothetical protein